MWSSQILLRILLLQLLHLQFVSTNFQIQENVIFRKQAETSLSNTEWKLTLVVDLNVYKHFFEKTLRNINKLDSAIWSTTEEHKHVSQIEYMSHYEHLYEEVKVLENITERIRFKFDGYQWTFVTCVTR